MIKKNKIVDDKIMELNAQIESIKNEDLKAVVSSFNLSEYQLFNSSFKIGEIIYNLFENIIENYKIIIEKKIKNVLNTKIKSSVNLESLNIIVENKEYIYQNLLLPEFKMKIIKLYIINYNTVLLIP